jgi:hypothetical protein
MYCFIDSLDDVGAYEEVCPIGGHTQDYFLGARSRVADWYGELEGSLVVT